MARKSVYRTRAQEKLLTFMKASPGTHHTAAEIRDYFAGQEQPIGVATIYRQLERFAQEGQIQKYILGPGKAPAMLMSKECDARSISTASVSGVGS